MNRRILNLAIPNILSNLTVPLLGTVDTALMGHQERVELVGAMALGGMIFSFLFWGFGFLRMGTTGLTAQAYGENNTGEAGYILFRASLVGLVIGVAIIALQAPLLKLALWIVNGSAEVEALTEVYVRIRILSAPATLLFYVMIGWFLGMQNAVYPMILTVVINGLNVVLDLLLVYGAGMDIDGVAWGSVMARYGGLFVAYLLLKRRYPEYLKWPDFHLLLDLARLKDFFVVNRDIFIRTLCLIFAFAFFTARSATYGDTVLAANTILMQLWMIFSYGIDGFAFAAESLVGRFIGARDRIQLKQAIKYIFGWGMGLGALGTLIYGVLSEPILSLFTDKSFVIDQALSVMIWTIIAPLVNAPAFIWDGVFIGATATPAMRNSVLVATILVYLPLYFVLDFWMGVHALWIAMVLFMITRGLMLSLYAPRSIFRLSTNTNL